MHPALSEFPSSVFYDGTLQNAVSPAERKAGKGMGTRDKYIVVWGPVMGARWHGDPWWGVCGVGTRGGGYVERGPVVGGMWSGDPWWGVCGVGTCGGGVGYVERGPVS